MNASTKFDLLRAAAVTDMPLLAMKVYTLLVTDDRSATYAPKEWSTALLTEEIRGEVTRGRRQRITEALRGLEAGGWITLRYLGSRRDHNELFTVTLNTGVLDEVLEEPSSAVGADAESSTDSGRDHFDQPGFGDGDSHEGLQGSGPGSLRDIRNRPSRVSVIQRLREEIPEDDWGYPDVESILRWSDHRIRDARKSLGLAEFTSREDAARAIAETLFPEEVAA